MTRIMVSLTLVFAPVIAVVAGEAPTIDPMTSQVSGVVVFDPKIYGRPTSGKAAPEAPNVTNVNTTQNAQAQNETTIDINPLDGEVLVGGMNDYRASPSGDVNCGFARTSDSGLTWTAGILTGITRNNGGPFNYDAAGDRYDTGGSTLAAAIDSSATSLSVATTVGPVWTSADGSFDIVIGGERMTVTAVAGGSSPQTFTVTRSVNLVTKAHAAGAAVELADPIVYIP